MPEKFKHIKGLLLVLVLWLTIGSIISDVIFFTQMRGVLTISDSADLEKIYKISLTLSAIGTLLGFYAAYRLTIKAGNSISATIYVLWLAGPVATFVGLTFLESDSSHLFDLLKSCIPALAWTVYLKRSDYVKSVYVESNQQEDVS